MTIDIGLIEEILSGTICKDEKIHIDFAQRLLQVYNGLEDGESGKMDLAVLIRHALRFLDCQADSMKKDTVLRLKKDSNIPSKEELVSCGLYILNEDINYFYLQAQPWKPTWLTGADKVVPEAAAFANEIRRRYENLLADPFILQNTKFLTYNNSAQREAIRAMVTMPPGATLVINIPTGSGKSLCAWLPALLEEGLTVVVVPTVALALDQEKALQEKMAFPLAYHGGEDVESQRKRKSIREKIINGEQSIIFTSPESLSTSLYSILLESSRQGKLSHFIVDEAHIIYEWGNDFRSAFQKISGVRRAMLRASDKAFKTVLLSATFTDNAIHLLKSLFSYPGPFQVLSSVQLRDEHSFWFSKCTEEEKEDYLLEAVRYLPRPIIIYTSKVNDAKYWYQRITASGFKRVGILTGKSTTDQRNNVVEKWKYGKLDIVIGTSAFGLGIDQAHVRTVIHACVPESVDRYYQEVGRGGRDGKASISLVIYTDRDKENAKKLNTEKILTVENGWERWYSLFASKKILGDRRYNLNLKTKHKISLEEGDYNEGWNLKTLLLMVQAGLIALDEEKTDAPIKTGDILVDEKQWQQYLEEISAQQVVEILDFNHLNEHYWKEKVESIRKSIAEESERGLNTMFQILEANTCTGHLLKDYYTSEDIPVIKACGGCPACRRQSKPIQQGILPTPLFFWNQYNNSLKGDLLREFENTSRLFIFHHMEDRQNKDWDKHWTGLVKWLAQKGILSFSGKENVLQKVQTRLAGQRIPVMLYNCDEDIFLPPTPRLLICPTEENSIIPYSYLNPPAKIPSLLLLPYETKYPNNSTRLLRTMIYAPDRMVNFRDFINNYKII